MADSKVSKHRFETKDLLDLVDETKLGKGANLGKKKTSKKKKLKIKKPAGRFDSLNNYSK